MTSSPSVGATSTGQPARNEKTSLEKRGSSSACLDLDHVGREVADAVDPHVQLPVVDPLRCRHAHAHDARAALDRDPVGLGLEPVRAGREVVEEVDVQERRVDGVDLEEVEPVQRRVSDQRGAARALVGADHGVDRAHPVPPGPVPAGSTKRSTRRSSAARRR